VPSCPAAGACASPTTQRTRPRYNIIIANSVANEGMDLQTRTCAMHHLDLPWTSADLEQRNGRAVRQGNELDVVQIYYYLSDRSMDWYRYSTIQGKRAWLSAILESQARDTSNPGAQQNLTDEEILMMISRDPESTQEALEARGRGAGHRQREDRPRGGEPAHSGQRQVPRRARDVGSGEGRPPAGGGRRAPQGSAARRRGRVAVGQVGRAGARARGHGGVGRVRAGVRGPPRRPGRARQRRFFEFGRIVEGERGAEIGKRDHGAPLWQLLDTTDDPFLRLQPAELDAGAEWPAEDEADLLTELQSHITRSLADGAPLDALQWRGASDAWLTRWWPRPSSRRSAKRSRPAPSARSSPLTRTKDDERRTTSATRSSSATS
jgi:hypothetical protein